RRVAHHDLTRRGAERGGAEPVAHLRGQVDPVVPSGDPLFDPLASGSVDGVDDRRQRGSEGVGGGVHNIVGHGSRSTTSSHSTAPGFMSVMWSQSRSISSTSSPAATAAAKYAWSTTIGTFVSARPWMST